MQLISPIIYPPNHENIHTKTRHLHREHRKKCSSTRIFLSPKVDLFTVAKLPLDSVNKTIHLYSPPMQHHSFFRNKNPYPLKKEGSVTLQASVSCSISHYCQAKKKKTRKKKRKIEEGKTECTMPVIFEVFPKFS